MQGTTFLEAKKKDQQAAKNRKIVAEQSVQMADCFERISTAASQDVSRIVEEKLEEKLSQHQRQMTDSVQQMLAISCSKFCRIGMIKLLVVCFLKWLLKINEK